MSTLFYLFLFFEDSGLDIVSCNEMISVQTYLGRSFKKKSDLHTYLGVQDFCL